MRNRNTSLRKRDLKGKSNAELLGLFEQTILNLRVSPSGGLFRLRRYLLDELNCRFFSKEHYSAIIEEINRIDVGGVDYVEEDEHPELSLLGRGSGDLGAASGSQHQ